MEVNVANKRSNARLVVAVCAVLVVITLALYAKTLNHQFLNFDDPSYVTANAHVSAGITAGNVMWAFTSLEEANWHPVTWLSHMLDVQLYGLNPGGHHLSSAIIHTLSSVVLLLFLFRATGALWRSFFVAAMFALHPLHVESVAWVSERKDVLCALFGFLALLCYAEYLSGKRKGLYLACLLFFVLGLMSKPMLVTLPVLMLLLDLWPFRRWRNDGEPFARLIVEKIPFFALSLVSGIATIYAQHKGGATRTLQSVPFLLRGENAAVSYVKYLGKTVWPSDLAVLYPMPSSLPPVQVIGALALLAAVSVLVVTTRRRFPYLLTGWLWFLVTLLPVIGLIQVGSQSMADRYSYIPSIGLFIMAAWGGAELGRRLPRGDALIAVSAGVMITAAAAQTWRVLDYWRDNVSLYRHALEVTSNNSVVLSNLGLALAEAGDLDGAIRNYQESIRINPNFAETHNNLAIAYSLKGRHEAAVQEFQESLRIQPEAWGAHYNLGMAYALMGRPEAALVEYRKELEIHPGHVKAQSGMQAALEEIGRRGGVGR